MENFNNNVFGFGNESNEELNQATKFDYDSISGLGESNYENEDLFNTEIEESTANNSIIFDNYYNEEPINNLNNNYIDQFSGEQSFNNDNVQYDIVDLIGQQPESGMNLDLQNPEVESNQMFENETPIVNNVFEVPQIEPIVAEYEAAPVEEQQVTPEVELENREVQPNEIFENETPIVNNVFEVPPTVAEYEAAPVEEQQVTPEVELENREVQPNQMPESESLVDNTILPESISISDTPMEELNKLTHYEEERIEQTDINSLFERVNLNVKDASDIFRRNTDLKQKIDTRFEQLKKLQSELENSRKKQLDEVNKYKEEVLTKLTEKKEEIERRLDKLKIAQASLEKEKQEFEQYKKEEQENISKVQKEVQSAYDDRREELNHIEDVLRKQKDSLDEERSQLSLDRIQYESDKNELANNLLKFNELVNSFTNGMNGIKE